MTGTSDAEVIALLKRYKCPTPFHEVRTRFLGNIASPVMAPAQLTRPCQETLPQLCTRTNIQLSSLARSTVAVESDLASNPREQVQPG